MKQVLLICIILLSGIQIEAMNMHDAVKMAKCCVGWVERPNNEGLETVNSGVSCRVKRLVSCSNLCRCGAVGCCLVSHPVVGVSCSVLACCFDVACYDTSAAESSTTERKGLSRFHGSFDHSIENFINLLEQEKRKQSIDIN